MESDTPSRMTVERERELVANARLDMEAFAELYRFYVSRVYGFIYRRVQDRSTAEDITSLTFQRALVNVRREGFRNQSLGGWLYRVAANAVMDHFRRSRRDVSLVAAFGDTERGDAGIDAMTATLDRDEVRRALRRLSKNHLEVLLLRFYDDLDTAEICVLLGCSREVLAVRLHRALRALRSAIEREATDVA
jgi:RNA polymerase sigma-70 factor, ECF subfamily